MSSDIQFGELFEAIWTMDIAKQIKVLFDKMGTPTPEPDALDLRIKELTDNARKDLIQAIKRKEMNKVVGILGITPVTYVKGNEE